MLRDPHITSFTIVTTPFKAKRDGEYFLKELEKRKFPVGAMVVNRLWPEFSTKLPPESPPQVQELVTWYKDVSTAHSRIWEEVSLNFLEKIPKLVRLPELAGDLDGLQALYEMAKKMEL